MIRRRFSIPISGQFKSSATPQTHWPQPEFFPIVGHGRQDMRTIYNLLFLVGFALASPIYFLRLWRRGNWREGFGERFGRYSSRLKQALTNRQVVWIHGVSVGESNLATLLVRALESELPHLKFVVSTTTTTGMGELRRKLPASAEKIYFPIDRRKWVRRAFAVLHPKAVILIEAELWPNFLWQARRRRVPVMLVNARISDRSFRRYRRGRLFFRRFFEGLAAVTTQSERDAQRMRALGCANDVVHAVGSLKFETVPVGADPRGVDLPVATPAEARARVVEARTLDVPRLLRQAGMPEGAKVLLAGSTHEGEEAVLAEIFRRLKSRHPDLYLVLVPRHFERSKSIGSQLDRRGVRHVYRSEVSFAAEPEPGSSECLVVNSTGELRFFYPHATVVFIGKSLVGRGGQNPIEPAETGRAIVFGPHMQNFPDIVPKFLEADAAVQVPDAETLEQAIDHLLSNPARRETLGRHARRIVESNRGALEQTVQVILAALEANGLR